MGFIYKIVIGEDIYIGSTKNKILSQRQGQHNYKLRNGCEYILYKKCRENNIKKIICRMIEKVDNNKLLELEDKYIRELKPTLNKNNVISTTEDVKQRRKKEYDIKYKEKIKCDLCGSIVSKGNLKKHQSRMICRKMWDISLLFSDDEE